MRAIRVSLLGMLFFLGGSPAMAGDDWQLVWVTHDGNWKTHRGHGTLQRSGNVLHGVLVADDDGRTDYRVRIELGGRKAAATFQVVSENDEASRLIGSYKKWTHSGAHCPEQIQLINDHEYLGLARNACKP